MLLKQGFEFPAKLAAGNPSARKAYDEGYFIVDNTDQIFHLKMVNSMPFLKKVPLPNGVIPVFLLTMEPDDRSFYAFVFDTNKKVHIISTDSYKLQELPTPIYDLDHDQLLIMANPLYWNVNVISSRGKKVLAIKADTKEIVDDVTIEMQEVGTNYSKYVLPFSVGFTSYNSKYIIPIFHLGSYWVLLVNLILAFGFVCILWYRKQKIHVFSVVWILITGVYGFITNIIFNR